MNSKPSDMHTRSFEGHKGSISAIVHCQMNNRLYTASDDGLVNEWDLNAIIGAEF